MTLRKRIGHRAAVLALCTAAPVGVAQNYDILQDAQTTIYVETDHDGNGSRPDCDWYTTAPDLLAGDRAFGDGCQVIIRMRGTISREGALLFSDLVTRLTEMNHRPSTIVLDSRGGDADAAISIARRIRDSEIFRAVPVRAQVAEGAQSVCFSACVVVFSAAYERQLEFNIDNDPALPSRIGIHGPGQFDRQQGRYDSSGSNSEIARVSRRLKEYFAGIGVDEQLVDDMFAVPFDEIRLLSKQALVNYGLYAN